MTLYSDKAAPSLSYEGFLWRWGYQEGGPIQAICSFTTSLGRPLCPLPLLAPFPRGFCDRSESPGSRDGRGSPWPVVAELSRAEPCGASTTSSLLVRVLSRSSAVSKRLLSRHFGGAYATNRSCPRFGRLIFLCLAIDLGPLPS